jgi:hypothetical protein
MTGCDNCNDNRPHNIPDDCESQVPFCDPCAEDSSCFEKFDAECVFYHRNRSDKPSRLTCLGLPNNTSVEQFMETIDSYVCNSFNIPFSGQDSRTIHWTAGGPAGHEPTADVILSNDEGQIIIERSNGLFAENSGKVRVDNADALDYLENQITGATSASGDFTIDVSNVSGVMVVTPILNIETLIANLCSAPSFEECIQSHQADPEISADDGNIITLHGDGLYASGGDTTIGAENGVHLDGDNMKLGGTLIENTEIDFNSGSFQLSLVNRPKLSIGTNGAITEYLKVFAQDDSISTLSTFYLQHSLDESDPATLSSIIEINATGISQSNTDHYIFANSGQLWINIVGNSSLSNIASSPFTGLYGTAIKSGVGDIGGNIISGGYFAGFGADSGDVSEMAGVRIGGLYDPPAPFGGSFSGTVANFYGIYIEDITGSTLGSSITNKWAIYQSGVSDISRFFGAVQNAGGGLEFTSDARVKENIESYAPGLDAIKQINVKEFNYTYKKDKRIVGVIAQELETALPGAVTQGEFTTPNKAESYTDFRFIDQNRLFYTMLNAIKELSAKVTALENK